GGGRGRAGREAGRVPAPGRGGHGRRRGKRGAGPSGGQARLWRGSPDPVRPRGAGDATAHQQSQEDLRVGRIRSRDRRAGSDQNRAKLLQRALPPHQEGKAGAQSLAGGGRPPPPSGSPRSTPRSRLRGGPRKSKISGGGS